ARAVAGKHAAGRRGWHRLRCRRGGEDGRRCGTGAVLQRPDLPRAGVGVRVRGGDPAPPRSPEPRRGGGPVMSAMAWSLTPNASLLDLNTFHVQAHAERLLELHAAAALPDAL